MTTCAAVSAIAGLGAEALSGIMQAQGQGRLLHLLESRISTNDATERAEQFLLLGLKRQLPIGVHLLQPLHFDQLGFIVEPALQCGDANSHDRLQII